MMDESGDVVLDATAQGIVAQSVAARLRLPGDARAPEVAAVAWGRVAVLLLTDNALGDAGVAAIARALHHVPRLHTLALDANDVGDAGAVALARAAPTRFLARGALLDLRDNGRLTPTGVGVLHDRIRCVRPKGVPELLRVSDHQSLCVSPHARLRASVPHSETRDDRFANDREER
jgi:hypothetical protein